MRHFAVIACVLALCACKRSDQPQPRVEAGKAQVANKDPGTKQVDDIVESASQQEVVLQGAQPHSLLVDSGTAVVLDGQKATALDIPAGSPVRAAYTMGADGKPHATSIEARTRRGVGENAPVQRGQPKLR